MSLIRPFKAIRPKKEYVKELASKPYDVLNSDEARTESKGNKYSFLHVVKSEIDLPLETDVHDIKVYEKAKENFDSFINDGILFKESQAKMYVYAQTMNERTQFGIVACASIDEYENDIIKKHEFTRKDKEEDRINHVNIVNANTGPVFLTYKDHDGVNYIVNSISKGESEYDFTSTDGVRHQVWVIDNNDDINKIQSYFKEIPSLYVADGHHRSASAYKVGKLRKELNKSHNGSEEYNFFLAVFFPSNQLMIMDYNRLVKDLNGLNTDEFFNKLGDKFEIKIAGSPKPCRATKIGMYIENKWYTLTAKQGSYPAGDPVNSLDVAILQNNVLSPILGIGDPRTDTRIDFVGGIRGIKELETKVDSGEFKVAFVMFPTTTEELMNVADAGLTMPPKSTWFEPKLKSGLLSHSLD